MGPASIGGGGGGRRRGIGNVRGKEDGGVVWQGKMNQISSDLGFSNRSKWDSKEQEEMLADIFNSDDDTGLSTEDKAKMAPVVLLTDQNDEEISGENNNKNKLLTHNSNGNTDNQESNMDGLHNTSLELDKYGNEIESVAGLFNSEKNYKDLFIIQMPAFLPKFEHNTTNTETDTIQSTTTTLLEDKKIIKSENEASNNEPSFAMDIEEDIKPKIKELESIGKRTAKNISKPNSIDKDKKHPIGDDETKMQSKDASQDKEEEKMVIDEDILQGQIGEVVVHKSGKVYLDYGGIKIELINGIECQFSQQLVALDSEAKQLFSLGAIKNRLVGIPDLEFLFSNIDIE
ncbi:hypothetical protein BB558_003276 [Smittium angustum]|uniref:DNA-directed RNA polymerase III subunit RPC4 n=1 Tax=Smittium angustum TaxID=133377 RepID=A0A2U1J6F7_SMIAN|nr:hypothetical protein BB558_003276 [Smittium angustum]